MFVMVTGCVLFEVRIEFLKYLYDKLWHQKVKIQILNRNTEADFRDFYPDDGGRQSCSIATPHLHDKLSEKTLLHVCAYFVSSYF
jgi:hypothetical protein